MRLDVGSGGMRRDGYIGVDRNPDCHPDVIADVGALPFRAGTAEHVIAADVLEHVLPWQVGPTLAEWARVLAPGGRLSVRVPNLAELGRRIWRGEDVRDSIVNILGGHRWGDEGRWDCHHVGFTPETLRVALEAAGLSVLANDGASNMTAQAVLT